MGAGRLAASLLLSSLIAAPAAAGVEVSMGVGAGFAADLGDGVSGDETRIGVAPSLIVPIRVQPLPYLRARVDLRLDVGWGRDQLTWSEDVNGTSVRFTDSDAHTAIVGVLGVEAGLDAVIPTGGRAQPYVGATVGVAGVGVYHALDASTAALLDPAQNDLGDPSNVDPHTVQAALLAGAGLGVQIAVSDRVDLWVETGYSAAFVGDRPLRKTPPGLDARREAFGWNPIRAGLGVWIRL